MEIRPAERGDRPAIENVVAVAFDEAPDGRVVQMMRMLESSGATRIELVADHDAVVGHVLLSRAWIDTRAELVDALMLTPLAVAPDHQGRGVGTALLGAALEGVSAAGWPAVLLEGDPRYYGARGFTAAEDVGLGRPSDRIPRPAFQVARLAAYEPWMTGRVVYPEAVWAADCVGLRDPRLARIEAALTEAEPRRSTETKSGDA